MNILRIMTAAVAAAAAIGSGNAGSPMPKPTSTHGSLRGRQLTTDCAASDPANNWNYLGPQIDSLGNIIVAQNPNDVQDVLDDARSDNALQVLTYESACPFSTPVTIAELNAMGKSLEIQGVSPPSGLANDSVWTDSVDPTCHTNSTTSATDHLTETCQWLDTLKPSDNVCTDLFNFQTNTPTTFPYTDTTYERAMNMALKEIMVEDSTCLYTDGIWVGPTYSSQAPTEQPTAQPTKQPTDNPSTDDPSTDDLSTDDPSTDDLSDNPSTDNSSPDDSSDNLSSAGYYIGGLATLGLLGTGAAVAAYKKSKALQVFTDKDKAATEATQAFDTQLATALKTLTDFAKTTNLLRPINDPTTNATDKELIINLNQKALPSKDLMDNIDSYITDYETLLTELDKEMFDKMDKAFKSLLTTIPANDEEVNDDASEEEPDETLTRHWDTILNFINPNPTFQTFSADRSQNDGYQETISDFSDTHEEDLSSTLAKKESLKTKILGLENTIREHFVDNGQMEASYEFNTLANTEITKSFNQSCTESFDTIKARLQPLPGITTTNLLGRFEKAFKKEPNKYPDDTPPKSLELRIAAVTQNVKNQATEHRLKLSEKFKFEVTRLTTLALDLPSKRLERLRMMTKNPNNSTDNDTLIPLAVSLFNIYMEEPGTERNPETEEPGTERNPETFIKNIKKTIVSCSEQGLSIDEPVLRSLIDAIKTSLTALDGDMDTSPITTFFNAGEIKRLLWESHLTTYLSVDNTLKQEMTEEELAKVKEMVSKPALHTLERLPTIVEAEQVVIDVGLDDMDV